jgi:hypothetical protein
MIHELDLMERAFAEMHRDFCDQLIRFGNKMVAVDYATIYERYAEAVGRPPLTDAERRQAVLAAILESAKDETI